MTLGYVPTVSTLVFISLFLVVYILVLVRNAVRSHIDFYDLLLLSTVSLVPAFFAFFPSLAFKLARIVGVEFPFLLLFGGLFFVVFAYLYRLVIKVNFLHNRNIILVQELGFLRQKLTDLNSHEH